MFFFIGTAIVGNTLFLIRAGSGTNARASSESIVTNGGILDLTGGPHARTSNSRTSGATGAIRDGGKHSMSSVWAITCTGGGTSGRASSIRTNVRGSVAAVGRGLPPHWCLGPRRLGGRRRQRRRKSTGMINNLTGDTNLTSMKAGSIRTDGACISNTFGATASDSSEPIACHLCCSSRGRGAP